MDIDEQLIIYTYHSLERMSLRGISRAIVKAALSNPGRIGVGYNNRQLAFKDFKDKTIKIVYTCEDEKYIVISVIWE